MSSEHAIDRSIAAAADAVGTVWPLHSFVTANPLAGFEDRPFHEAVADAESVLGGRGYPTAAVFEQALESGAIDPDLLRGRLAEHGYETDLEASLDRLADNESVVPSPEKATATERVDAVVTKWLAAFLDQGRAEWPMPDRESGFYAAFCAMAPHDSDIPDAAAIDALPSEPTAAIRSMLTDRAVGSWQDVFEFHLAALPGWTGLIKQRAADNGSWQSAYPITLAGYLAVRLALADGFDAPIVPPEEFTTSQPHGDDVPLEEVWLSAWEETYRTELVTAIADDSGSTRADAAAAERPDAQLVFCIDTRSEIIRRHIESTGAYETHGYAGFFGIPMRYEGYDSDVSVDACPPILEAQHHITDQPAEAAAGERSRYDRWHAVTETATHAMKSLKSNAATAFSFVESAGMGYAAALAVRTIAPSWFANALQKAGNRGPDDHEFCAPSIEHEHDHAPDELPTGLTLDERVEYAATAFELMGIEQFARVVAFVGHASETANNPFESSLDCGACAGNPGGPNARVLAAICNDEAVQAALADRGIEIPDDTVFVAGEHTTTTDEVTLYTDSVPETHADDIAELRADLSTARERAAGERAGDMGADPSTGVRETERRAADWAETRPEWGLAGNAGFVIGPRALTAGLDLDGRAFLHSYDWRTDSDGSALEAILAGPMVVTQWINTQYYFSTVDNAAYGSGSKVTHNPVGNIGVYQGNGGDLMTGLPLQSTMAADNEPYHQPLRLSTIVHAPVDRVTDILADHPEVAELLDNGWLSLTVIDPQQDGRALQYEKELAWTAIDEEPEPIESINRPQPPAAADD
ncbi:DUF2309 domain-containing protein [Halalkalirubrum salinum]|uniref:DUF2309 domain-containing protein n=1 Tax=Halalkalirubrum salinum TaxID=2563889 RepID=UPI0010FBB7B8|nr:DUF2309 domain-containing protein [Halalkalirubrum salinum]